MHFFAESALSRSGKKILHIDKNEYYGQAEAALSIQEVESWVEKVNQDDPRSPFKHASIKRPDGSEDGPKLGPSRSYSLALAPSLIYTRSKLLPALVSSHVHEQIDFQAVGSWFVYEKDPEFEPQGETKENGSWFAGKLGRVPNSREDVFADPSLSLRAKGALVKFLRFVANYEEKTEEWEPQKDHPFPVFLADKFRIPADLHGPLMALTMSTLPPQQTSTGFAIARIANHLRSIGLFGPGFSAVLAKWGGLSEIAQVGCRAGAVGGAVYVLGRAIESVETTSSSQDSGDDSQKLSVQLTENDKVSTDFLVGSDDHLSGPPSPASTNTRANLPEAQPSVVSRSITVVSSSLPSLFPAVAEGSPNPAGAVVVFPSNSLNQSSASDTTSATPPVHILVHSGDTGECPKGQSVIYASIAQSLDKSSAVLETAVSQLLASTGEEPRPHILWALTYEQHVAAPTAQITRDTSNPNLLRFQGPALDTVYDEEILHSVKEAWETITGQNDDDFMKFDDRNNVENDVDEL